MVTRLTAFGRPLAGYAVLRRAWTLSTCRLVARSWERVRAQGEVTTIPGTHSHEAAEARLAGVLKRIGSLPRLVREAPLVLATMKRRAVAAKARLQSCVVHQQAAEDIPKAFTYYKLAKVFALCLHSSGTGFPACKGRV